MRKAIVTLVVVGVLGSYWLLNDGHDSHEEGEHHDHHHAHSSEETPATPTELISPIPKNNNYNAPLARIGFQLFNDPSLSSNGEVSCASCHNLASNGAELTPVSTGVKGVGERNSLTVFNASLNYRFFWDGRANTLLDQLDGPVENPVEMDSNWEAIEAYVLSNAHYSQMFSDVGIKINTDNIKLALTEFLQALNTPNAPFDRYLEGDKGALSEQEARGWDEFQQQGCINCHRGVNIGGGLVTRFGYFGLPDNAKEGDLAEQNMFRVASLRNVAETPPYFHDGSVESLREAIVVMAKVQLGRDLDEQSVEDIHSFLLTLSGEKPQILQGGLDETK